jgi:hypothetical protein
MDGKREVRKRADGLENEGAQVSSFFILPLPIDALARADEEL